MGPLWPRQTGSSFPDCPALGPDGLEAMADEDGIVCLAPVRPSAWLMQFPCITVTKSKIRGIREGAGTSSVAFVETVTRVWSPEQMGQRIVRFADVVGREHVMASTDCGFASTPREKPEVHPTIVEAKFRSLVEGAKLASAKLF